MKYSKDKNLNELVDMIMYTRKVDKMNNKIGIIDKEQENFEKKLNENIEVIL